MTFLDSDQHTYPNYYFIYIYSFRVCGLSIIDSLPEMDPVAFVHHSPNVTEAAVVFGALSEYSEEAAEHDDDLEDVRPHDCLHAALERE